MKELRKVDMPDDKGRLFYINNIRVAANKFSREKKRAGLGGIKAHRAYTDDQGRFNQQWLKG